MRAGAYAGGDRADGAEPAVHAQPIPRAVRVFAHREPVDMRKSFDTLAAVIRLAMANDVMGGDVFVFVGRRRRHAKVLWWDGTGMVLIYKVLEQGSFAWPKVQDGVMRLSRAQAEALFEGLDWRRVVAQRVLPPAAAG